LGDVFFDLFGGRRTAFGECLEAQEGMGAAEQFIADPI